MAPPSYSSISDPSETLASEVLRWLTDSVPSYTNHAKRSLRTECITMISARKSNDVAKQLDQPASMKQPATPRNRAVHPAKRTADIFSMHHVPVYEDDSDDECREYSAVDMLIQYLIELYFGTTLNAKQLCTIMWYLAKMGYKKAEDYALDPFSQSGKFQPKLDKAFDFQDSDAVLYDVDVPQRSSRSGSRKVVKMKTQLAHEVLANEIATSSERADVDWQAKIGNQEWIAAYENHPQIKAASPEQRKNIHACALYMDAAAFSDHDSLYVFTIRFVWSPKRHLLWAVRKSNLCDCGCSGWCTFYILFSLVAWSLQCAQKGKRPCTRHDGLDLDELRMIVAGEDLMFKAIVIDILGDWKEFSSSWGFPPWNATYPCFICPVRKAALTNPHALMTCRKDEEYDQICRENEIAVPINTMEQLQEIRFKLQDMSTKKGRALREDVYSTIPNLTAGDRLEPSADTPDVYGIDDIVPETFVAMTLIFWRACIPVIVTHRNPLITRELGIGYSTFSIDVLHCEHLGVFLAYITRVIWLLLSVDAFGSRASVKDDHLKISAQELTSMLHRWYKRYEKGLEPEAKNGMTRVNYLTHKMLGNSSGKMVKLKAAESRHFMEFARFLTQVFESELRDICDYDNLVLAGDCLRDWMWVVNHNPRKLSPAAVDDLCRLQHQHNISAAAAGVHMLPKHHQALSLLFEAFRNHLLASIKRTIGGL